MTVDRAAHGEHGRRPTVLMVFLALTAFLALGFLANEFDRRAIHWGRAVVSALFALPPLFGFLLVAAGRRRAVGIAYAAGIGAAGFAAVALPAGLLLIFLAVQTPEQRHDTYVLMGYASCALAVAVAAWIAHLRQPPPVRRGSIAWLSMLGVVAYGLMVWKVSEGTLLRHYDRTALIREFNERQAPVALAAVAACARRQAALHADKGYPANMDGLSAGGCLPRRLQRVSANAFGADGYVFYYFADPADWNGRSSRFAACARTGDGGAASVTLGLDPAGRMREVRGSQSGPSPTCFAAWAGDDDASFVQALAGCLLSASSSHPGQGYAPTFWASPSDPAGACEFRVQNGGPGGRLATDRGIVEYLPRPAVAGVITGYALTLYGNHGTAIELDHAGQAREFAAGAGPLTAQSLEVARPAAEAAGRQLDAVRRNLTAACVAGDLKVCEDLGDLEWDSSRPAEANRWWDTACERGRLTSCLLSSRYNPMVLSDEARQDKERCRGQGDASYCRRLDELAQSLRSQIEELRAQGGRQTSAGAAERIATKRRELAQGCEAGKLELCENLGDLEWDTGRPDEANRWWDRACEGGRLQACLVGTRYNPLPSGDAARRLRDGCRQGVAGACGELEAMTRNSRARVQALLVARPGRVGQ